MLNEAVSVYRTCQTCQGEKVVLDSTYCSACGTTIAADDIWWQSDEADLPCGHEAETHLVADQKICPECQGQGKSRQWVSDEEFRQIRLRRLTRGIVLLAVALLVLLSLAWAFFDTEPDVICGSWWYGVGLVLLAAWPRG